MILKAFKIFFFLLIVGFYSCSLLGTVSESHQSGKLQKLLQKEFDGNYFRYTNSDSSFVLYLNKPCGKENSRYDFLKVVVIKNSSDSLIYKDSFTNACVKWYKRNFLEINLFPEMESAKPELNRKSFRLNVLTKRKYFN